MGLHRPGLKAGLSRRRSAALQDRWDRQDDKTRIKELEAECAEKKTKKQAKTIRASKAEKTERIKQLQDDLETADKHIGWLKDDKSRLNKSIEVRDNAFDALIDMNEKNEKQLQAELATAKAENEHLCDTIESTRQDYADMIAGTLEGRLQAKLDKHRWIPVEERLPEKGSGIFFCKKNQIYIGRYGIIREVGYEAWAERDGSWHNALHVTHWKPQTLPEGD